MGEVTIPPNQPVTVTNLQVKEDLDILWLLICAYLIFFMQCGFALFEAGAVRLKNVKNILFKNVIDASVSAITWWAVGYAFAFGECEDGPFIGSSNFFLSNSSLSADTEIGRQMLAQYMFSWAFSATATTIVGGAIAERTRFRAYILYTAVMNGLVYPVVVHWVWSTSGWLSGKRINCATVEHEPLFTHTNGVMDFAGSGVVHVVGGAASLCGVVVLGSRLGRFSNDGHIVDFPANSPAQMTLGVFILWFAWYGFNTGSTGCMLGCMYTAAKVSVNTTLSAGAGGLTVLLVTVFVGNPGDIGPILNGILVGLVSITGACAFVQPYAAVVIGSVGGIVYVAGSKLMRRLRLDDVVDATPVHLFGGAWGLLATGLFSTETSTIQAMGYANGWGLFYGGPWRQMGMQVLGLLVIAVWVAVVMVPLFTLLNWVGWFRVSREDEENGLDFSQSIGTGLSIFDPKGWTWAHR